MAVHTYAILRLHMHGNICSHKHVCINVFVYVYLKIKLFNLSDVVAIVTFILRGQ